MNAALLSPCRCRRARRGTVRPARHLSTRCPGTNTPGSDTPEARARCTGDSPAGVRRLPLRRKAAPQRQCSSSSVSAVSLRVARVPDSFEKAEVELEHNHRAAPPGRLAKRASRRRRRAACSDSVVPITSRSRGLAVAVTRAGSDGACSPSQGSGLWRANELPRPGSAAASPTTRGSLAARPLSVVSTLSEGYCGLVRQTTGFARVPGAGRVAFAVVGSGPAVVLPAWWVSHVVEDWDFEPLRRFVEGLAAGCMVVRYDRLGTGVSDRERLPRRSPRSSRSRRFGPWLTSWAWSG